MKAAQTPNGYRYLRAVSIAVGLVSFLVIVSVGYSVYADYRSLAGASGTDGPGLTIARMTDGPSETVTLNATITNPGLYPLEVTMSCSGGPHVACDPASVLIQPGSQGTLSFTFTVVDVSLWASSGSQRINGTVTGRLVPFASISVGLNFGALVQGGGG